MKTKALSLVMVLLSTLFLSAFLSNMILPAAADTKIWTVDDGGQADFRTIQEAINAANSGDTIFVYGGTYKENIVLNKTLYLTGENKEFIFIKADGASDAIQVVKDNVRISGFTICDAGANPNEIGHSGITLTSNNNTLIDNVLTENSYHGLYLFNSDFNTITQNFVYRNHWCGIVLQNSSNNTIYNNNVVQNLLNNNGIGILLQDGSSFNVIESNTITRNDGGIGFMPHSSTISCNDNIIRYNNIFENIHDGIFLYDFGQRNFIALNSLLKNGGGIHLSSSPRYNTIVGNNITSNTYGGIGFDAAPFNRFYHNNLVGNTPQVWYKSNDTSWDDGYPSGGNYWSDYNGKDADNDGIGDTPYIIDENNKDRYPLMTPSTVIDPVPTPTPTPSLPPDSQNVTILEVSCFSSSSLASFSVEINGSLTWNGTVLSNCSILLSVSDDSGISWSNITNVNTNSNGKFEALWTPKTTGSYLLRALWAGNSDYPSANATISFAVTPFEDMSVFSVSSNSTVSEFFFNSTSKTLSFSVTGPSGTTGYVNVCIPKTILTNASDLKVFLDDAVLPFTAQELLDLWYVSFNYHHSIHQVKVSLDYSLIDPPLQPLQITSEMLLILSFIIVALLIFAAALLLAVRKPDKSKSFK